MLWYDFTVAIHRMAGITSCKVSPLHTDEYPAKAPRPQYSVLDKTKIKRLSVSRFPIGRIACRSASIGWRSKQNNTYLNIIPYIYGVIKK